jgi:succinoglycan biosynthesis protein ExoO
LVPNLGAEYRNAGVVISPLTVGSGLKIKLVEAMGQGKAVVATTPTIDGVEHIVGGAVAVADAPVEFADAIVSLLQDANLRGDMSSKALATARRHFSCEACYAEIVAFANQDPSHATPAMHA